MFHKIKKGAKTAMKDYAKKLHKQLDDLVIQIRSPLWKNDRKKFNTVLIIEVHARDIIDGFVRDSIVDEREFEWESPAALLLGSRARRRASSRQCTRRVRLRLRVHGPTGAWSSRRSPTAST